MSEARSLSEVDRRPSLAKYELMEELGHGGMATVYRAYDRRLDRDVAVKVIHRHLRENKEVGARFTSEAKAVAKLRHPNIVDVYDVSEDTEPERYLVVELVRGTTLRKLLIEHTYLPPEIAAAITIEVADALSHAHQHGVIHRDVKPENVLLDLCKSQDVNSDRAAEVRARIKITDFGIAKLLDAQGVTSTGQVLGSPAHMSPEQIEGGTVTPRSDVFGLGVLLYEALVGALPFDGKNPAQVLRKVLDGKFTPAERARSTVGTGLSQIADRALAHDPDARYATPAEMAAALQRELIRTGFDDYRRELDAYLCAHREYVKGFEERVVAGLVAAGRRAQVEREVPVAAACFNRALAYRPDNLELLRLVSGLAHAQRVRQTVRRGGIGFAVALLLTVIAYFGIRALNSPVAMGADAESKPSAVPIRSSKGRQVENRGKRSPAPRVSVAPEATAAPSPAPRQPIRIRSTENRKQRVQVQITSGAIGGYVWVNGQRLAHGDFIELKVGESHTFKFRPPDENPDCCQPQEKTEFIDETTTIVTGQIPFLDAKVIATGAPDGSKIDCGINGLGTTPVGFVVHFGDQPEIPATCSVIPPTSSGQESRTQSVKFQAGKTIDLWQ